MSAVDTTAWHRRMVPLAPHDQHLMAELLVHHLAQRVDQAQWDAACAQALAMLPERAS